MQQGDPIRTAKLVASVDLVSNGRFLFGVGGGFPRAARRTIRYGEVLYLIPSITKLRAPGPNLKLTRSGRGRIAKGGLLGARELGTLLPCDRNTGSQK